MKKITSFLMVVCAAISLNAQCDLADDTLFTGDYIITQTTPGLLGYDTFDPDGGGVTVTLFSGMTDASQVNPGVALSLTQRSFDATYIAQLALGNPPISLITSFPADCGATFEEIFSNVQCNTGITLGPASGGTFDAADDSSFVVFFSDDITDDCGEGTPVTQLTFTKGTLGVNNNKLVGFNYFVQDKSFSFSSEEPIDNVEFFNLLGQRTLSSNLGTNNGSVDISTLPTGVYIANVRSGDTIEAIKIAVK